MYTAGLYKDSLLGVHLLVGYIQSSCSERHCKNCITIYLRLLKLDFCLRIVVKGNADSRQVVCLCRICLFEVNLVDALVAVLGGNDDLCGIADRTGDQIDALLGDFFGVLFAFLKVNRRALGCTHRHLYYVIQYIRIEGWRQIQFGGTERQSTQLVIA